MKNRRVVTFVGLALTSGALFVACAGAPRVDLTPGSARLGLGPLPFSLPALHAPAPTPIDRSSVLADESGSLNLSSALKLSVPTTETSRVTTQETILASGGCHH